MKPNFYLEGKAAYSTILEASAATARGWRLCTIIAICIAGIAIAGVVFIGSQSKIKPVLVVMKDDFIPVGIFAPQTAIAINDERVTKAILARLITSFRTVSTDRDLQGKLVNELAEFVKRGSSAFAKIQSYLADKKTNPFTRAKKETVEVKIVNVLKITASTWQVDWIERTRARNGQENIPLNYRANLTFTHMTSVPATTLLVNPTGLLVSGFNWARVAK